ncbi:MAG: thioredoxin family protein [Bryobacterales bacterium]|jgi:thiol:disulfide interchange protein|nr:thioredoxin family protein [Bryobacterales bacterium]
MRPPVILLVLFLSFAAAVACPASPVLVLSPHEDDAASQRVSPKPPTQSEAGPGEVDVYDPARDAAADIRQAVAIARKQNKHVLLEVGGAWCIWCKILDRYFADHPDLLALRKANYVMVKVNFSKENENAAALGAYPKASGYPHFYVLDSQGALLRSQDTAPLEEGRGYHHGRMRDFLSTYKPKR